MQALHWFSKIRDSLYGGVILRFRDIFGLGRGVLSVLDLTLEAAVLYSYCWRRELEVCSNRCLVPSRCVFCSR